MTRAERSSWSGNSPNLMVKNALALTFAQTISTSSASLCGSFGLTVVSNTCSVPFGCFQVTRIVTRHLSCGGTRLSLERPVALPETTGRSVIRIDARAFHGWKRTARLSISQVLARGAPEARGGVQKTILGLEGGADPWRQLGLAALFLRSADDPYCEYTPGDCCPSPDPALMWV